MLVFWCWFSKALFSLLSSQPFGSGVESPLLILRFSVALMLFVSRAGRSSDIYLGTNVATGEEVAMKLESTKSKHPQLVYEAKLYKILQGAVGIPYIRWYGVEGSYNVLVMDLLGYSLEDLFNRCGRRFSLKTVLMIADQILLRVEYVHSKSFIHRDIKPDNFLIGLGRRSNVIYVIDFGLAKRYRDPKTHVHIMYRENKHLTGTPRYASINNHLGIEQSRRDDLESLGYVFMYFLRGSLPWQGLRANTKKQKYQVGCVWRKRGRRETTGA